MWCHSDKSRGAIYDRNIFMIEATGGSFQIVITKFVNYPRHLQTVITDGHSFFYQKNAKYLINVAFQFLSYQFEPGFGIP